MDSADRDFVFPCDLLFTLESIRKAVYAEMGVPVESVVLAPQILFHAETEKRSPTASIVVNYVLESGIQGLARFVIYFSLEEQGLKLHFEAQTLDAESQKLS